MEASLQPSAKEIVAVSNDDIRSGDAERTSAFGRIRRGSSNWSWAFVSQGVSSATSFGLTLLAGRALGASGLGVIFAGFTAYAMLLTLHRALIATPLISSTSALTGDERVLATRTALTMTLAGGVATAAAVALLGAVVGGAIGHGLLVFAPWLVPAFAQDLFRSSLVRDGRARRAAVTDLTWLATLAACIPLAAQVGSVWAIVAAWGMGAVVAAGIGGMSMASRPTSIAVSRAWFRRVAFPFGRWLALQEGSFVLGFYGLYVILTAILGVHDLGGLRAAESVFAPFTLLAPALMLVGLPAVSRAFAISHGNAVKVALRISGACVLLTLLYSGVMLIAGGRILTAVFGDSFEPYEHLVVPMSVGQIALAAGLGFGVLLRAEQRGKANLVAGTTVVVITVISSTLLATQAGIEGAVWGLSLGAVVGSIIVISFGVRGAARWERAK